jgi:hypothetical protein
MAGRRLEDLGLRDEPLPDLGWSSYLELDAKLDPDLNVDLDDDPSFARFCHLLRSW